VQSAGFEPLVPQVTHVSYPNPARGAGNVQPDKVVDATMVELESLFKRKISAEEVAALFVETIQGEGGYIVPPDDFLPRLRELCDKHGILLVCDEVQSGMGRTGRLWAVEHFGVEPDMVASAKGIASGLPLGALIARGRTMDWPHGAHASTFGGNPVSCAASLATFDLLEAGLMANAAKVGDYLLGLLTKLAADSELVCDARGKGLMVAIDIAVGKDASEAPGEIRNRIVMECFNRGLLLLGCGESAIRFCPALTVSEAQIDAAVAVLTAAIESVEEKEKRA